VVLRSGAGAGNLFLLPAVSGEPFPYVELARRIEPGVAGVIGLVGTQRSELQLPSIEEMAARYVKIIRELQPVGPYRLGGWSLGGVMAYETAVQLTEAGQEVDFLGLLDSGRPDAAHAAPLEEDFDDSGDAGDTRTALVDGTERRTWLPQKRAMRAVLGRYAARRASLRMHLFCVDDPVHLDAPLRGWDTLLRASDIELAIVPGDHDSMLEAPYVDALAEVVSAALRRVTPRAVQR
jgi:syringomycin synthetase protein SyrE